MKTLPERATAVLVAAIVALVAWTALLGPPPRWLAWPVFVLIAVVIWASARYLIDGPAPTPHVPEPPMPARRPNIRTRYSPLADWVPAPEPGHDDPDDDPDDDWEEDGGDPRLT